MSESDALIDALARASFLTTSVLTKLGAEYELSLTQMRVLAILRERTVRMSELAEYLGLERSSLSGLIDRAEQRGLVNRERSAVDRRAFDVSLTDEGRELAKMATARSRELLHPLIDRLAPGDQRRLCQLLDKIA